MAGSFTGPPVCRECWNPTFFAWPGEVGGTPLLQTLARRVARFNWVSAPPDTAANLYQTVIPAAERRQLGEYYTPSWLAPGHGAGAGGRPPESASS